MNAVSSKGHNSIPDLNVSDAPGRTVFQRNWGVFYKCLADLAARAHQNLARSGVVYRAEEGIIM
jgi:hypothetical protein